MTEVCDENSKDKQSTAIMTGAYVGCHGWDDIEVKRLPHFDTSDAAAAIVLQAFEEDEHLLACKKKNN